ncbi:tetratricopeptide repeat protein [Komarekiella sp. 'clone 1']|uniref:Tetratricopeptide repeat protein n=1 Tax=Komarekiella delphini-convector SJRDD-AB1 TaxID=2593771 RepID=A0AA40T0T4_9NOST|nr:CHAT domain-containing tetratricopeptide repeat protein [Komarekiella delphini-convector]MBD6618538.1 tetratricopeptide repeat protein [Komarekiella delphini-convector SJRDD-AB1]
MKKILTTFLVLGVSLTPLTVMLIAQPTWGQTQNSRSQEAQRLLLQGIQLSQQQQHQQAIQILQQALTIAQELKVQELEAFALLWLGRNYNDLGQKQKALDYYNQALPRFRAVGDHSGEAITLNNIGKVYNDLGQKQKALDYFNQTLPLLRAVGDRSGEATTLNNIGGVYSDLGQKQKALDYLNQALPLRRAVGDHSGEATTLSNIGLVYSDLGQKQKALDYYNQALPLRRAVGDHSGEATTLSNIGLVYSDLGQKQKALDYYNQALPLLRAVGERSGEATTLNNIGQIYDDLGQKQKALNFYNQALPLFRAVGNRSGEATTRNDIGAVYNALGQKQKAHDFFNQALPLFHAVGDRSGESTTLNNLGAVSDDLGQKQIALDYYNQALSLIRAVGDRSGEATTLNNIGLVYSDLGEKKIALDFYNQALPLLQAVGERSVEAVTLNNIGLVYDDLGQKQKALDFYNQALPLRRAVGDRSGEAVTLGNIGVLFQNTNRPTQAITNLQQALQISLEMRRGLQRENRQNFLQENGASATALVDVLINQKKYAQAFEWVNLFTTADLADYTRLINAKVANPEAQQSLDNWSKKNQQLESLRQQLQSDGSESLPQKIRQLEAQVYSEAENISRRFPEVAELFETTPADIKNLTSSIPIGTVVVQPVLLTNVRNMPNNVAFFIFTKGELSVIKKPIDPTKFNKLLTQYLKQVKNDGDASYAETGGELYDILIRPIEDRIKALSPKQLSIIATGKLRHFPFETLYDSKTNQFLIQKYPVNYLTRISNNSLKSPGVQNAVPRKAQAVLAFGNPVPRNPQNIPGAEAEVRKIKEIFPESEVYIHNEATLEKFKSQALRFSFLHLATHGCFKIEDCKKVDLLNNKLLFADKPLDIADAALLGLQGTQLLTLSACETAVETDFNGEGIAGVAYIFERAGAKAVMASLWAVEDEATQELMVDFYQNLKQGMSKGEALQKAKLKLIKDDRHPFYWSPFVLIGDAR